MPPDPDRYRAAPGMEDRYGEMTGAISINLMIVFLPVTVWSFFIGPALMDPWPAIAVGVALAVALSISGIPVSRWVWVRLITWMERTAR